MATVPAIDRLLEPEAVECCDGLGNIAVTSAAISLKRIADALEKLNSGDVNAYGIGAEIGRGMGEHYVATLARAGR